MKPFSVNTPEFLNSQEFCDLVGFITGVIETRAANLADRYPEYKIKSRCHREDRDWTYYPTRYNTPFFDAVCETLLHKDNNGFLEVNEFSYQLNCFSKAVYHRKLWADKFTETSDQFFTMIWNDWQDNQKDDEFDNLKSIAHSILSTAETLTDYHRDFVYNPTYSFVTVNDVREIFDQLVEQGIFLSNNGDLYQVFENVDCETADMDTKTKLKSGQLSKLDEIYIRSKFKVETIPALEKLQTKFNFIPIHGDISKFEPLVALVKLDNKIWFVPQFLVFYS